VSSVAEAGPSVEQRERLFFFIMALAIAATVVPAFWLQHHAGFSSFGAPWWVHVHAVTFMGWVGFYLVQNTLVWRGDVAQHQWLGRIGAGYVVWMVLVGLVLVPMTLAHHRTPPFFTPAFFLALDWTNILFFGGLIVAALINRHRSDWHRRLMLCATVCVMAPAWGRLIVLSGHQMTAPVNIAVLLPYVVAGMLFDLATRRRIHPAYLWGFGTLVAMAVVIGLVAALPPFASFASSIAT
jgi:hypothetical protein